LAAWFYILYQINDIARGSENGEDGEGVITLTSSLTPNLLPKLWERGSNSYGKLVEKYLQKYINILWRFSKDFVYCW
jgi:hypothetical protein